MFLFVGLIEKPFVQTYVRGSLWLLAVENEYIVIAISFSFIPWIRLPMRWFAFVTKEPNSFSCCANIDAIFFVLFVIAFMCRTSTLTSSAVAVPNRVLKKLTNEGKKRLPSSRLLDFCLWNKFSNTLNCVAQSSCRFRPYSIHTS